MSNFKPQVTIITEETRREYVNGYERKVRIRQYNTLHTEN
jgi:hypothetical protein